MACLKGSLQVVTCEAEGLICSSYKDTQKVCPWLDSSPKKVVCERCGKDEANCTVHGIRVCWGCAYDVLSGEVEGHANG
jgi:hypothetical protein